MTLCKVCGANQNAKLDGRSMKMLRFFFGGVVGTAWRAIEHDTDREYESIERLRYFLHVESGYYTQEVLPPQVFTDQMIAYLKEKSPKLFFFHRAGNIVVKEAKSIAFGRISNPEFTALVNASITVICGKILPGVKRADLVREIENLAGVTLRDLGKTRK